MHTFLQEQMVLRHHNEAESLNAVQKMDWEWKLQEINSGIKVKPAIDDLHVPMVQVPIHLISAVSTNKVA